MAQNFLFGKSSSLMVTSPRFGKDVANKKILKFKRHKGPSFSPFSRIYGLTL